MKDIREGQEFAGKPKKVSWERLWAFSGGAFSASGWPKKNIHTDLQVSKDCGLSTVAASGTQFEGYVIELMIDLFGIEWLSNGSISVKFIGAVDAGDTVTAKAKVKSREMEKNRARFLMDVWVENQKNEKVLVGTAAGNTVVR